MRALAIWDTQKSAPPEPYSVTLNNYAELLAAQGRNKLAATQFQSLEDVVHTSASLTHDGIQVDLA